TFNPMSISTGTSSSVTLDSPDFSSKTIVVSGTVSFGVNQPGTTTPVVTLSGSGALKIVPAPQVYLTDTTTGHLITTPVAATAYDVGLSNGTATVNAAGNTAVFSGVTLGLAYYRSTTDSRSWMGLETFGGSIQTGSSSALLGITNVQVSFNK